jgi:hypothetical protein
MTAPAPRDNRIETKVTASTVAAAVSALVVMLLDHVIDGDVPPALVDAVYVIVPAVCAFLAGYAARHTHRPTA